MRRALLLFAAIAAAATTVPTAGFAQRRQSDDRQEQEEEARRRKRDEEWNDTQAPLPALRNAGPCPFVKVLYDAARYVEFRDNREASGNVGFTGEIQGISAACQYKGEEPIRVAMEVLFEMGRGPQAGADSRNYRYWVAVTQRNQTVIAKQYFDLPVKFEGKDRVYVTDRLEQITIPRAEMTTSGANFEVLVGFDVTPQMAAFNRDGKRFRLNVGAASTGGSDTEQ